MRKICRKNADGTNVIIEEMEDSTCEIRCMQKDDCLLFAKTHGNLFEVSDAVKEKVYYKTFMETLENFQDEKTRKTMRELRKIFVNESVVPFKNKMGICSEANIYLKESNIWLNLNEYKFFYNGKVKPYAFCSGASLYSYDHVQCCIPKRFWYTPGYLLNWDFKVCTVEFTYDGEPIRMEISKATCNKLQSLHYIINSGYVNTGDLFKFDKENVLKMSTRVKMLMHEAKYRITKIDARGNAHIVWVDRWGCVIREMC